MGILIPNNKLTNDQLIKLYSNPVSGIACEFQSADIMGKKLLQNIRYSKSMMLGALRFWIEQYCALYLKLRRIDKPFLNMSSKVSDLIQELISGESIVKKLPDSFLFSHRYIQTGKFKDFSDDNQCKLLKNKYPMIKDFPLQYQKTKHDPYFKINIKNLGIEFTVFPNEHPYIPRQKISKVGMTDKGNIYILHRKKK